MTKTNLSVSILAILLPTSAAVAEHKNSYPIVREYVGAKPKNENRWIGFADYPSEALRNGEQGNVIVAFDITIDGRAKNCIVDVSSGSQSLDRVPCKLIERNARFQPASDGNGPVAAKGRYSVAFWQPD